MYYYYLHINLENHNDENHKFLKLYPNNLEQLFDRYHLGVVFEHPDYALKRTKPIKAGEIDESSTVYVGDGCFGCQPRWVRTPRRVGPSRRWYPRAIGALGALLAG